MLTTISSRFQSPGVSARAVRISSVGQISDVFERTTQGVPYVHTTRHRVSTPVPANRGPRSYCSNLMQDGTTMQMESTPKPCRSLISRMALSAVTVTMSPDRRDNRKSVDRTRTNFKRRFSDDTTEDWMTHTDALKLNRAKKHDWTATNFFYALKDTLILIP